MPVIVGVPRSGTTLLRMMLDAHPGLAIPPETGFLPPLVDIQASPDNTRAAVDLITRFHTWPDFGFAADDLRAEVERCGDVTPADVARTFYAFYAARFGKERWGDKTPTYGAALDRIEQILPEARFIHIIRDGRDVALSVRPLWFRPGETVEACAADWAARIDDTRARGSRVAHYLEVRYEALVTQSTLVLQEICKFIDLRFEPQMLCYYLGAGARLAEHQARYAEDGRVLISKAQRVENQRLVKEPPRADRVGRWKTEMTAEDLERFDAVAGDWLARLGYAPRDASV
jgi:sulfotransferase family protein